MLAQLRSFLIHLRIHYQFLILSGAFLYGGVIAEQLNVAAFLTQFLSVHLLLFGGATAYNSYWDKDEGPIGGLKHPPAMSDWMWSASLLLQAQGLLIAATEGTLFVACYLVSALLFWAYSSPLLRWKGHPILSLIAIAISTGTCSVVMGFLAASIQHRFSFPLMIGAVGAGLVLVSLYPVSQLYQLEEDGNRGDRTFAIRYGKEGVLRFFVMAYLTGAVMIGGALWTRHATAGMALTATSLASGLLLYFFIRQLKGVEEEYGAVMRVKYLASFGFVAFLTGSLFLLN